VKRAHLLLVLALAACRPPTESVPKPVEHNADVMTPPASPPRELSEGPVITLAGEWRVAGIDGQALDQPVGLALSADAEEIWWAPRCAGFVRTYRISRSAFATGPAKGTVTPKPGVPPPPVCAIGLPPRLDEVTRAIASATIIRRTGNGGVELSGGGHSLLLFAQ
jgi:hypothetical protein